MDTFSPPFEPQNSLVSTPIPQKNIPTWQIILAVGIILLFIGVGGFLFLWLMP